MRKLYSLNPVWSALKLVMHENRYNKSSKKRSNNEINALTFVCITCKCGQAGTSSFVKGGVQGEKIKEL